jgi:hypothetical protein
MLPRTRNQNGRRALANASDPSDESLGFAEADPADKKQAGEHHAPRPFSFGAGVDRCCTPPARHAGLDPASRFFLDPAAKKAGPRIKSGVTIQTDRKRVWSRLHP